ncbi:putative MFS family arabinose efflux permease [Mycetocola sp. BIGb0189]|uniref:MFS transporter n=1 Tax=Mycetocola sp. BIGb0189 TaxID=2940604 RepID=UPI002168D57B|nr:MFS transporter [Mycetocola sp. BIGb0189]MCS4274892.1 putative MFS family arabinose efflux permease [Mycetocola sp. BIGb0189]
MSSPSQTYTTVLRTPHVVRSFLPSILGRLSLATSGLALILLLEHSSGSFAIAGAITAVLGIANVVATPIRARLIDRHGQTRVLAALGLTHAASLVALGVLVDAGLPTLVIMALIAGASSPPFGASMRVLWSTALPAGPGRSRGFSLDAVAEEVTFALGPLLVALLAILVDPFTSLMFSAGCVALGTLLFVTSTLSRRQRGSREHGAEAGTSRARSPLRSPGFPVVVVAMIAPGIILGCIEIAAPAIARTESHTMLAGILLALFAGASAVGGLLYGRLSLRPRLERQLLALVILLVFASAVSGLIGGTLAALIGFAISGLFLAPLLIVGYLAADSRTDPRVRTEASSWINTAVNLGAALGAALFGALVDPTSPGIALALSAALALLVVLVCAPRLLRAQRIGVSS